MNTLLRGSSGIRLRHLVAGAALFALLAPTAGLLADTEIAGWSSNHGHAGQLSAVATHSHPYDDHHAADLSGEPSNDVGSEVTFTLADDAGTPAVVLSQAPASLPSGAIPNVGTTLFSTSPLGASVDLVPTPPPRA